MPTDNKKLYLAILVLVVLLVLSLGWNIFSSMKKEGSSLTGGVKPPTVTNTSLFDSQNATFMGKVTAVEGNKLTVESNKGVKGEIMANENLIVLDPSNPIATPSSDLKKLQLNKDVIISLMIKDNQYIATALNYVIPLPSFDPSKPPPLPSAPPGLATPPPPVPTPSVKTVPTPSPK